MTETELPNAWRARAAELKRFAPSAAEAFEQAAADLDAALRTSGQEALSLREAAVETGYSERAKDDYDAEWPNRSLALRSPLDLPLVEGTGRQSKCPEDRNERCPDQD